MLRTYKADPSKKQYKKYNIDILSKAVDELALPDSTLKKIAEKYNIHISVLYRHSKKTMKPQGGQTALSSEEEKYLVENINICAEWGYPLDTMDLRCIVKMYLDKLGVKHKRFKNNLPGPDFVEGFLKRHKKEISQRICENIKRSRAAVSSDTIKNYHIKLQKTLEGVPPTHILNYAYDETNLTDDPGQKKVLVKRGHKYPERVNHTKASTSLMMAGTAGRDMLPPYVVYKSLHLYDTWVKNGPENTRYNRSSSGWFEGKIFEDWVLNMVIPYFNTLEGRKCLIGDNLSSHLSIDLIRTCKEHNIDFVFLPPNSTHLTQPLDIAFFRPIKQAWRQILLKWKKTDGRSLATIPKGCFPKLLNLLISELKDNSKNNIKAGIFPLNVNEILSRLPQDSHNTVTNRNAIDESVLTLLKEMRFGTMNVLEPKRKRKLIVVAGQSVVAEDIEGLAIEEGVISAKKSKTNLDDTQQTINQVSGISVKGKGTGKNHKKRKGVQEERRSRVKVTTVPEGTRGSDNVDKNMTCIKEGTPNGNYSAPDKDFDIEAMPIFICDEYDVPEVIIENSVLEEENNNTNKIVSKHTEEKEIKRKVLKQIIVREKCDAKLNTTSRNQFNTEEKDKRTELREINAMAIKKLKPIALQDKLIIERKIKDRSESNILPMEEEKKRNKHEEKKNYYNNSQEILKVLTENYD